MLVQSLPSSGTFVHDPDRLAVLDAYNVLDTAPEEGYDDLVQLAALACATPVALVSFVTGDRQWFKARVNFPPCETDLDRSVCKFALAEPDLLVIPDLAADPRTATNPLVTDEPHIRFYAGAPLRTPDGQTLGSLCVIDHAPRPEGLSEVQAEHLRRCARQVMGLLEMRRAVVERDAVLARQHAELRRERHFAVLAAASGALLTATDPSRVIEPILATSAASLGFEQCFIYDIAPDRLHLQLRQSIGATDAVNAALAHVDFDGPLCGIVAQTQRPFLLSDILASHEPRYALARHSGINAFAGFPVMSRNHLVGVISFCAATQPAFDEGALTFFATIARYLSAVHERLDSERALRESAERLQVAQEAGRVGTYEIDIASNHATVSPELCRLYGIPIASNFSVERIMDCIVPEDAHLASTLASRAAGSMSPEVIYRVRRANDGALRWIKRNANFVRGDAGTPMRMFGTVQDITEQKARERRSLALIELGDRLRDMIDTAAMTATACEVLGTTLDLDLVGYGLLDPEAETLAVERDWFANGARSLAGKIAFGAYGSYIGDLKRGETVVVPDVRADPRTCSHFEALESIKARAFVNVPLFEHGAVVALLYASCGTVRAWTADELTFMQEVASRLRLATARAQAEADQRILNHELSHRLKNTLAIVTSIASQSLRSVPDRGPVEAFQRRIHALAAAHDLLLRASWSTAQLRQVCEEVLRNAAEAGRITFDGPDIAFGSRAALSASLLLHELATNAVKYGSLSTEAGQVELVWGLEDGVEGQEVVLDWRERNGPQVVAPTHSGFGSRLIRMGLVGTGGVSIAYNPDGVQVSMRAPLREIQWS